MPRDGSGVYSRPPGTDAVADTTIDSAKYNNNVADVEADLNAPRPIVAGGTAATSADAALTSLSGEKAKQVVANWDSTTWRAGSFYAATSATGAAPVAAHAFAGIAYYANATDFVCEATDLTDVTNTKYIRVMAAGVWGAWTSLGGGVRYDIAQTLTANQKAQARANIDSLKKNYFLNGAMMVSQEYPLTQVGGSGNYPVDQFQLVFANAGVQISQQVASPTPGGSPNRLRFTVTTADAVVAAGDYSQFRCALEGLRVADLRSGSAVAKTVTLRFGCKGPAGTYCVSFMNSAFNRTYVAEYTIAAGEANTDVIKSIALTMDAAGTWLSDNGVGLDIRFVFMCGTTFQTATPNTWFAAAGGPILATANQFNFLASTSNVFELFDVSLTEGGAAPAFQVPDYANELVACQRYFETAVSVVNSVAFSNTAPPNQMTWKATKRVVPTLSATFSAGSGATFLVLAALGMYQNLGHSAIATATVTGNARL